MNEAIEVRFQKNGKRLRVKRQLSGGIEFDEPDPIERTVGIQFNGRGPVTQMRMDSIRRIQGWDPGQFKLNVSVEDGFILLRGVTPEALPEGIYELRLQVEEAKSPKLQVANLEHDGRATVVIEVEMDDRTAVVDLSGVDAGIGAVLDRSTVDGAAARDWLAAAGPRPTRHACLLNLMAFRTQPSNGAPLVDLVRDVFLVANDRIYARVDRKLLDTLQTLADDPDKKFFAEGKPHAPIHGRLLTEIPEPPEVKSRFKDLLSFRAEGRPSMQVVIAVPPPDLPHAYADLDLDLGNPLQDVVGFFVHMGELLDGKPTNHLDLRKALGRTKAAPFLCYTVAATRVVRAFQARRAGGTVVGRASQARRPAGADME